MIEKYALRDFRRQINCVLLEQWDPIGIREEPAAQNEYEMYVYGTLRLLVDGASEQAIARYLLEIEHERMGLDGTSETHRLAVAAALKALRVPVDDARRSAS